jgi:glycosyl hydrolase family 12
VARRFGRVALWVLLAALLIGLGPSSVEAQFPQTCSSTRCIIDMSSSTYVIDNQWDIGTASGTQSVTVNSTTSWSTTWNWNRPEEWNVTTYAAAITGWHWGWHFPPAQTGFPLQLSAGQSVRLDTAFNVQLQSGTAVQRYDVAYDIWFHPTATPADDGSNRYELMIWLAYSRDLWGSPSQVPIATPMIGGHRWKVFTDYLVNGVPHYVAFVVDGPDLTGVSLDLKDFTDWLLANHVMLQPAWYLTSVEFGPEIYKGRGTLNVTAYSVNIGSDGAPAPAPPLPPPPPPFSIGATTVSPAPVTTGQGATITTQITAGAATSNVVIDLELFDVANTKITQQMFTGQSFASGQTRSFSWSWPGTSTEGAYMIKVGVFSGDWKTLYAWDNDAAPFSVAAAPPPSFTVTSTTASPDPVARNRWLTINTSVQATVAQAGVQLDIELYSATGVKVGQKLCTVNFAVGQTQGCPYKFSVPKTLPTGVYTVSVGVFNSNKTQLYTWVSTADTFTVK